LDHAEIKDNPSQLRKVRETDKTFYFVKQMDTKQQENANLQRWRKGAEGCMKSLH